MNNLLNIMAFKTAMDYNLEDDDYIDTSHTTCTVVGFLLLVIGIVGIVSISVYPSGASGDLLYEGSPVNNIPMIETVEWE